MNVPYSTLMSSDDDLFSLMRFVEGAYLSLVDLEGAPA
jgi:hypothetical protein